MHRFYLAPGQSQGSTLRLGEGEAYHAIRVLRVHVGEALVVLNGAGEVLSCRVEELDRQALWLSVLERRCITPPPCQVTLLQAVPKGKTFEDIIQKATELGVARVVPVLSEHCEVHLTGAQVETKLHKWRLTAIESLKQCGSAWLPKIEKPLTIRDFLARRERVALGFVASLQNDARHAREFFHAYYAEHQRYPQSLGVWIGPEGDFSPEEMEVLKQAGNLPITLGPLTLRTETAAIYCLAILNYELSHRLTAPCDDLLAKSTSRPVR